MVDITSLLESPATLIAFIGSYLIFVIALYVYWALALMKIAKKTNTDKPWLAWIPIANLYLMTQIAGVPWWTMLLVIFLPIIPILGYLAAISITVWWFWKIAEVRGKPGWWGILMIIPIVNLIILGILAWGK